MPDLQKPAEDLAELAMDLAMKAALVEALENDVEAENILKIAFPFFVRGARDLLQIRLLQGTI